MGTLDLRSAATATTTESGNITNSVNVEGGSILTLGANLTLSDKSEHPRRGLDRERGRSEHHRDQRDPHRVGRGGRGPSESRQSHDQPPRSPWAKLPPQCHRCRDRVHHAFRHDEPGSGRRGPAAHFAEQRRRNDGHGRQHHQVGGTPNRQHPVTQRESDADRARQRLGGRHRAQREHPRHHDTRSIPPRLGRQRQADHLGGGQTRRRRALPGKRRRTRSRKRAGLDRAHSPARQFAALAHSVRGG